MQANLAVEMIPAPVTRVDLHCHSTASQRSRLGVQRALGLPECATPPKEVYALAKRRGMDFVTITDHDTISGVIEIADRPDVFVSEELTAWFRGEPQAVHILCWGITPGDHDWLQAHSEDVEEVAEYLHGNGIACALAHPFYAVAAPLTALHRRRLARLFPVWETRNGSRARELNMPAAIYIETHGGAGVGGSDDHAGVDIGRTWTETPPASTPEEFLRRLRRGDVAARGAQGSAAKWAHAAMALAVRALGRGDGGDAPDPRVVLRIVERVMSQGDARSGAIGADLGPEDARAVLRGWLDSLGLDMSESELLAWMQEDGFAHADLARRACRAHERRLREAVERVVEAAADLDAGAGAAAGAVFSACIPAIPYVPAAAFLGREKGKLLGREQEPGRVALVADGVGGMHGVTHTLDELRERGVPGFEVEVIGTDPERRPAPARRRRGRGPLLRGPARGRSRACTRPSRRSRRAATTSFTFAPPARPGSQPRSSLGSWTCLWWAPITRSSVPTPGCAPATRACGRGWTWRWPRSTASARSSSRRARRQTSRCGRSESRPSGSGAGSAASTCAASTRPCARRARCPAS